MQDALAPLADRLRPAGDDLALRHVLAICEAARDNPELGFAGLTPPQTLTLQLALPLLLTELLIQRRALRRDRGQVSSLLAALAEVQEASAAPAQVGHA